MSIINSPALVNGDRELGLSSPTFRNNNYALQCTDTASLTNAKTALKKTLLPDSDPAHVNVQMNGNDENHKCIFCFSRAHRSIYCSKFRTGLARRCELIKRGLCIDCHLDGRHENCQMLQLTRCAFCNEKGLLEAIDHSSLFCEREFPGDAAAIIPRKSSCSKNKDPHEEKQKKTCDPEAIH